MNRVEANIVLKELLFSQFQLTKIIQGNNRIIEMGIFDPSWIERIDEMNREVKIHLRKIELAVELADHFDLTVEQGERLRKEDREISEMRNQCIFKWRDLFNDIDKG